MKRTFQIIDFAVPADHRVKLKENERKNKYLDIARELKKTIEHGSGGDTNCNRCTWYSHQRIDNGTRGLRNKRTSRDHPNDSTIKMDCSEYWEEFWRPKETCFHSNSNGRPSAYAGGKNSQSGNNDNYNVDISIDYVSSLWKLIILLNNNLFSHSFSYSFLTRIIGK